MIPNQKKYCDDIRIQSYECTYTIRLPYLCKFPWEDDSCYSEKYVDIDKCLLPEILELWKMGIKTTGCCCGHGKHEIAFIGVKDEHIDKMKELGYKVYFNSCRPGDEDSFIPKTILEYGEVPYAEFKH